jgi:hypothetical protein
MKKILLLLMIVGLLAGCITTVKDDLVFVEYREVDERFIVTFETSDEMEVNFYGTNDDNLKWLEKGSRYSVEYYNEDGSYGIYDINIYNEAFESED